MVQSNFVNIKGSHTYIATYGKWIDDEWNVENGENEVIVLIPGNPGFAEFYLSFAQKLHENTKIPVWILSYAGHSLPTNNNKSADSQNGKLYTLDEQVEHKAEFIRQYVPANVNIHLLGHSIGCWMSLQLLKKPDIKTKIKKCYFLFPTLERLKETPGFFLVDRFVIPYFTFFLALAKAFDFVPFQIRLVLFKLALIVLGIPYSLITPVMKIVDPKYLPNIVYLAADEEINVKQVDYESLEQNKGLVKLLYGQTDPFVPKKFFHQITSRIPDLDAQLTHMDHGFMVKHDVELANTVTKWIVNTTG